MQLLIIRSSRCVVRYHPLLFLQFWRVFMCSVAASRVYLKQTKRSLPVGWRILLQERYIWFVEFRMSNYQKMHHELAVKSTYRLVKQTYLNENVSNSYVLYVWVVILFTPQCLPLASGKSSEVVITCCCLFRFLPLLPALHHFIDTLFITLDLQWQTDS